MSENGYVFTSSGIELIPDVTGHREATLSKVYAGLNAAGVTGQQAIDAVTMMQNQGILFREKLT